MTTKKPYLLEDCKASPHDKITEVEFDRWQGVILANIKKNPKFLPILSTTWQKSSSVNRGLVDDENGTAAEKAKQVDALLAHISHYGPSALQRDINKRCTSLDTVWESIRTWAGLKISGNSLLAYFKACQTYDEDVISTTDFYYKLFNLKEDCLLIKNSDIKFEGKTVDQDEEMSSGDKNQVMLDWLKAIGGVNLVEHVFRTYSKDLEGETLHDIRQRVFDSIDSLKLEAESLSEARSVQANRTNTFPLGRGRPRFPGTGARAPFRPRGALSPRPTLPRPRPPAHPQARTPGGMSSPQSGRPCQLCSALNLPQAYSHSITNCFQIPAGDRALMARATDTVEEEEVMQEVADGDEVEEDTGEYDDESTFYARAVFNKSFPVYSDNNTKSDIVPPGHKGPIVLKRINIYASPILTVTNADNHQAYILLDTGATTSLIRLDMAEKLKLRSIPTKHKVVQIDGESNLKVLGEVHTTFYRQNIPLHFSALVINHMSTPIIGGTNFHVENDITSRMATNSINIGSSTTVQATSHTVMYLDQIANKQRLIGCNSTAKILPGEELALKLPVDMPENCEVMIETNSDELDPFFMPKIVEASLGQISVTNESSRVIQIKKNCKPVRVCLTRDASKVHQIPASNPRPLTLPTLRKTPMEIMTEVTLDGSKSMNKDQLKQVTEIIQDKAEVFQSDLPGYNQHFGPVYANFEFNSKARPIAHKLRAPGYNPHAAHLFNQKCLELKEKGVLADPQEIQVQPLVTNNSWLVKKKNATSKAWNECTTKDVRLVVGFDKINKYLQSPPGKITKIQDIYSNLASWKVMGELDFTDFYFQIPFNTETPRSKKKMAYLCIRTAFGTLCFQRAAMGLLGMDVVQDELTDKLFGDLVLEGKVCKIADNVYFGGETVDEMISVLKIILDRCMAASLRIKPSSLSLNIQSADILGLHWNRGTLSPSKHKLDPLAQCDKPKTIKGLRSFLGGVRFHEICLPGPLLAAATQSLDREIPASKDGKEQIIWTKEMESAFAKIQNILKNPLTITIPKEGDTPIIISDACTSLPAGGTKLLLQRPGREGYLPSFNFGCRLPESYKNWSTCEVEAFMLNKGIEKMEHFLKICNRPGICLIDSKPVVQAKLKLDQGKFSSSARVQNLLTNISAKRMVIQHISAKLPTPLLQMIDFYSRNPVNCDVNNCRICREVKEEENIHIRKVSTELVSEASWKDIQQSCKDLRVVCSLLAAGRRLGPKERKSTDIKRYLRYCVINKKGLLVAPKSYPFQATPVEAIVIPRDFAFTAAKALHVQWSHPSRSQMKKRFEKQYFILDENKILEDVFNSCDYPCQANLRLPKETMQYTNVTKATSVSQYFSADVLEDWKQKMVVVREYLTSFTDTMFIKDQSKETLRTAILTLINRLRLSHPLTIRTDAFSSLKSLVNDQSLQKQGIQIEVGNSKNKNKNPVGEKGIRELREQLLRIQPQGGPFSEATLALATHNLNSILRHNKRSSKELFMARDQNTGDNLDLEDKKLATAQEEMRVSRHEDSARYASRGAKPVVIQEFNTGDKVYIKSDLNKSKSRDSFIVLGIEDDGKTVVVQKFPGNRKNVIKVQAQNLFLAPAKSRKRNEEHTLSHVVDIETEREKVNETRKAKKKISISGYPQEVNSETESEDETELDNAIPEEDQENSENDEDSDENLSFVSVTATSESDDVVSSTDSTESDDESPPTESPRHLESPVTERPANTTPNEDDSSHSELGIIVNHEQIENWDVTPDYHLNQPPNRRIRKGDYLLVFSKIYDTWEKILIISHGMCKDKRYFNYQFLRNGNKKGSFFLPGQSWGFLGEAELDMDFSDRVVINVENMLQQEDGAVMTPASITPQSSPRRTFRTRVFGRSSSKSPQSLSPSPERPRRRSSTQENLLSIDSDSKSTSSNSSRETEESTLPPATHIHIPKAVGEVVLDRVNDLSLVLPQWPRTDRVARLDHVLPLLVVEEEEHQGDEPQERQGGDLEGGRE